VADSCAPILGIGSRSSRRNPVKQTKPKGKKYLSRKGIKYQPRKTRKNPSNVVVSSPVSLLGLPERFLA
jgi:hypothetical protein